MEPKDLLRKLHPNQFSDSKIIDKIECPRELLDFHLSKLSEQNKHFDFEDFIRNLLEREICPNLIEETGPAGGGDGKIDTENYPVSKDIQNYWWYGLNEKNDRWAFANDIDNWGGGYILIGVEEENGRPKMPITGLELSEVDKIQKELLAKCKLIQPSYTPIVDVAQYKGKNILVVWCFGGQTRPYKCPTTLDKDFSKGYSYYIRKMSSTVKATETEQKELYDMARTIPFDDRMNHEAEIRDLKLPLIQNYLYEIKSDLLKESETMDFIDLCKSMRIVDGTPEYMKPLNVGLMFFNDEPQKFFPYSQIEVVDLRNGPEGDDMTEQIFKGPIDTMIKSALTYIKNTVIVEKILKVDGQAEAIRFFNYPYQAIEEALVNAVYHRGYDVREPVEVRIMEDRIHIVSYPGPDRSISEKSIEDKNMIARKYRNRRIGEFLKELKLTEGRNTGVPKIKRALKNNGSKEPEFETNETRDYFITTIFMHDGFENEIKDRPRTD